MSRDKFWTCERKKQYPTRQDALNAITNLAKSAGAKFNQLQVYTCDYCKNYHVGHWPNRARRK